MKKILSLLAFFSLMAAGVYAQGVSGGLKLGLNLSSQTQSYSGGGWSATTSPSFRPTIHAGGYLTLMLSEKFGVQPEVLYSGQGYKQGDATVKMDYIAVPVLLRLNFSPLFSIHAGPQIGMLMSAKVKDEDESADIKDMVKKTDVGIAAGLGIDLPMGLNFGFRFVKGLTNVADDTFFANQTHKNYALQFSVGYKLFGKK